MAKGAFQARDMDRQELPALQAMLAQAELPPVHLDGDIRVVTLREADGHTAGFAGLELCGHDALLRSVVVSPGDRGRGGGRAVVEAVLQRAAALDVSTVYLLTTTAADFFSHLGFSIVSRDRVPARIAQTEEFARLCPASAVCMTRAVP